MTQPESWAEAPPDDTLAHLARPMIDDSEKCTTCGGTGRMPGVSHYLRETVGWLGDQADDVIRSFYERLLRAAPDLAPLFPPDLLGHDTVHHQRDRLLKALVGLSSLYDPADAGKMAQLDTALAAMGRHHAAFDRGNGTVLGATLEEYAAVKDALFGTLIRAAGDRWKPEHGEAWSQAYDYAAGSMLVEQTRSGFTSPRYARS